jgi:hypothetical protein
VRRAESQERLHALACQPDSGEQPSFKCNDHSVIRITEFRDCDHATEQTVFHSEHFSLTLRKAEDALYSTASLKH